MINQLIERPDIVSDNRLHKIYVQLESLLIELNKRELPQEISNSINEHIDALNAMPDSKRELRIQIRTRQSKIIGLLEKDLKIVTKNYYRGVWLALGIAIGLPMGVALGSAAGNMGYMAIGMRFGMVGGMAYGGNLDKKAFKEGRQLDIEIKN